MLGDLLEGCSPRVSDSQRLGTETDVLIMLNRGSNILIKLHLPDKDRLIFNFSDHRLMAKVKILSFWGPSLRFATCSAYFDIRIILNVLINNNIHLQNLRKLQTRKFLCFTILK